MSRRMPSLLLAALLMLTLCCACKQGGQSTQSSSGQGAAASKPAAESGDLAPKDSVSTAEAAEGTGTAIRDEQGRPVEMKFDSGKADGPGEIPGAKAPADAGYTYILYAGSYDNEAAALKALDQLKLIGYTGELVKTKVFLVRIATFDDYDKAKASMEQMEKLGFPEAFVTRKKPESDQDAKSRATQGQD